MSIQDHVDEHEPSMGAYLGVFTALLVLTAITVGVAFVDLGIFNNLVALGIAIIKAVLVIVTYLGVNLTLGSFIEPRILGRELNLSPLVVVISVVDSEGIPDVGSMIPVLFCGWTSRRIQPSSPM